MDDCKQRIFNQHNVSILGYQSVNQYFQNSNHFEINSNFVRQFQTMVQSWGFLVSTSLTLSCSIDDFSLSKK